MNWWTSDYHFSHANIIKYCGRPFETVEENETIIRKHNERVKPEDTVFFLGDFIQNKEIVKVEINEPWKMCYEEGLKLDSRFRGDDSLGKGAKCQKKSETTTIQANPRASRVMESVYFCAPSDDRWCKYRKTILWVLKRVNALE